MSEYAHLHEDYRHVMALSDRDRIAFMVYKRWIGYDKAIRLMELLEHLMQLPPGADIQSYLVTGPSGNGKSFLIERFIAQHGKGHIDEQDETVKPVIVAETRATVGEKQIYLSILDCFHAPHRATSSADTLLDAAVDLCRTCQVRLIIFDDINTLGGGTPLQQIKSLNALKYLSNYLKIPIVLFGTESSVSIIQSDPQHARRFMPEELPLWQPDHRFQRMLKSFEKTLPLRESSELHRAEITSLVHTLTGGNLTYVRKLLVDSATEAITNGRERIDEETLRLKACKIPPAVMQVAVR